MKTFFFFFLESTCAWSLASSIPVLVKRFKPFKAVKRFKPPIDISVFLLGNSYHVTDCLQNLRVVVSYIPHLRFKVEVSTPSAFLKLERFRALIAEFVNFQGKN